MKKLKKFKTGISPSFALDICQRNLDKQYISDGYDDEGLFESGYGSCLKDIAFLLLGDDNDYGIRDNK